MNTAAIRQFLIKRTGFDGLLKKVQIKSAEKGKCLASLVLEEEHVNRLGTLHGGLSSTLVDVVSSCALLSDDRGAVPSVSVDMDIKFLKPAQVGDTIKIDANVNRCGNSLAYLDVDISNEATGDTLVKGTHIKFLMK